MVSGGAYDEVRLRFRIMSPEVGKGRAQPERLKIPRCGLGGGSLG